ncbi:hypothetical protein AB0G00_23925 [Nocardia salmonicida]|uniref:hypothetical protein n=1 Tax=Nocardia salmonicida TaxID=53431 RepID=UPI0033F04DB1
MAGKSLTEKWVDDLNAMAEPLGMSIRAAAEPPYGWELYNAYAVTKTGNLSEIEAHLKYKLGK